MMFDWILLFNFAPPQNKNAALQSSIYRLIKLVISITLCLFFTYKVIENQQDSRFLDVISCYINHLFSICYWDLVIAHPPCTFLAVSGARWYYHPDDKNLPTEQRRPHPKFPDRAKDREEAVQFFMDVSRIGVNKLAIENPVGIMSSRWRKPDQIIEPWMFGHEASKKTCLWLKNLPLLVPTNIVGKGEVLTFRNGNRMQKWTSDIFFSGVSPEERRKLRSKTFPGIADAMANQWGGKMAA